MDLPESQEEGGYMDVPVEGGDAMYDDATTGGESAGGYMDVAAEDDADY